MWTGTCQKWENFFSKELRLTKARYSIVINIGLYLTWGYIFQLKLEAKENVSVESNLVRYLVTLLWITCLLPSDLFYSCLLLRIIPIIRLFFVTFRAHTWTFFSYSCYLPLDSSVILIFFLKYSELNECSYKLSKHVCSFGQYWDCDN